MEDNELIQHGTIILRNGQSTNLCKQSAQMDYLTKLLVVTLYNATA